MIDQPKTYYDLIGCDTRVAVFQGGTRSGKTWSILNVLCSLCFENRNAGLVITVVRKSFPSLRASVYRDYLTILHNEGWYDERDHNKTENTYNLFGNHWEFISTSEPQKLRGAKRNIAFLNEANELSLETYRQISLRTGGEISKIIMDYNPSEEFHWIYDEIIPREDCTFFQSTYLDNPFLDKDIIAEIELLKTTDEDYWRIYGLGERGKSRATIFESSIYTELPEECKPVAWGIDWGFSADPTALVKVWIRGNELYIEEFLYSGGLTNSDIMAKFREIGITRHEEIIADSAEPKAIHEIHRGDGQGGFNIKPAKKGADSIRIGIDLLRRHKLFIKDTSLNVQKEFRNYKWKQDKNNRTLPIPVDNWNHAVDAVRYICLNKLLRKQGSYTIQ